MSDKTQREWFRETQVKEYLSWFRLLFSMSSTQRVALKETVLEGLKKVSHLGEGSENTKAGHEIYKMLTDGGFKFMGFMPNIVYVKDKAESKDHLESAWLHAWAVPTLLFASKKLPIMIITNPGIRVDKTFITEMKMNKEIWKKFEEIMGATS